MDTPYTLRAQELRDIFNSLSMKYLTQDERLDVLLTVKHTVKEHDCKLTQEIIELIDREADLLMRGVKESNLEGMLFHRSSLYKSHSIHAFSNLQIPVRLVYDNRLSCVLFCCCCCYCCCCCCDYGI